jgi:DNA-binding IclR family transcriptional regulator
MDTGAKSGMRPKHEPQNHRTIDRVTQILEQVVYQPGISFAELVRAVDAAKSSLHGFISGLVATGWLYQQDGGFYLGPTIYGLTLANGHLRTGFVSYEDLKTLHNETGAAVFLGIQAGDHLIYIAEAGQDPVVGFEAKSDIRRILLKTAGGKALLAAQPSEERDRFLRRRGPNEQSLVENFLAEIDVIRRTGIAVNFRPNVNRFAIAAVIRSEASRPLASITLVGTEQDMRPRVGELSAALLKHVEVWSAKSQKANVLI